MLENHKVLVVEVVESCFKYNLVVALFPLYLKRGTTNNIK
jgi:hypothetical protein